MKVYLLRTSSIFSTESRFRVMRVIQRCISDVELDKTVIEQCRQGQHADMTVLDSISVFFWRGIKVQKVFRKSKHIVSRRISREIWNLIWFLKCSQNLRWVHSGQSQSEQGTSLVVQWLKSTSAGTRVRSLVQEDPTCHGATKPMSHNYLGPLILEPVLCNKKSHCSEQPEHGNQSVAFTCRNQRKPTCGNQDPKHRKTNK